MKTAVLGAVLLAAAWCAAGAGDARAQDNGEGAGQADLRAGAAGRFVAWLPDDDATRGDWIGSYGGCAFRVGGWADGEPTAVGGMDDVITAAAKASVGMSRGGSDAREGDLPQNPYRRRWDDAAVALKYERLRLHGWKDETGETEVGEAVEGERQTVDLALPRGLYRVGLFFGPGKEKAGVAVSWGDGSTKAEAGPGGVYKRFAARGPVKISVETDGALWGVFVDEIIPGDVAPWLRYSLISGMLKGSAPAKDAELLVWFQGLRATDPPPVPAGAGRKEVMECLRILNGGLIFWGLRETASEDFWSEGMAELKGISSRLDSIPPDQADDAVVGLCLACMKYECYRLRRMEGERRAALGEMLSKWREASSRTDAGLPSPEDLRKTAAAMYEIGYERDAWESWACWAEILKGRMPVEEASGRLASEAERWVRRQPALSLKLLSDLAAGEEKDAAGILMIRAEAFTNLQAYEQAVEAYCEAAKPERGADAPVRARALSRAIRRLVVMGEADRASALLGELDKLGDKRESAAARVRLAGYYRRSGNAAKANELLQQALDMGLDRRESEAIRALLRAEK